MAWRCRRVKRNAAEKIEASWAWTRYPRLINASGEVAISIAHCCSATVSVTHPPKLKLCCKSDCSRCEERLGPINAPQRHVTLFPSHSQPPSSLPTSLSLFAPMKLTPTALVLRNCAGKTARFISLARAMRPAAHMPPARRRSCLILPLLCHLPPRPARQMPQHGQVHFHF
jgi:hypothetical protein